MAEPAANFAAALAEQYAVERELGWGGMAVVYLARDLKHDRRVALKVVRPEISVGLGAERFIREIGVAARLQHPHILPLFDSGEAAGLLYYATPYVEGETLRERMRREGPLPLNDALLIAGQVAGALAYAHAQGVVHRDIKPENILLAGGEAIVLDFGIALAISEAGGDRITTSGMSVGTPAYSSPEQAAGGAGVDGRSDIYSLACVLYEMLGGEPPFSSPTPQIVLARHIHDPPPPLATLRPTVPPAVADAVARALAKVPADRYATAAQFAAALEEASAAGPRKRAWWRRSWSVAAGVVLVAGLVLAVRLVVGRSAYAQGLDAFRHWDMPRAQRMFRRAIAANPRLAPAHLWLAQTAALAGRPSREWGPSALIAGRSAGQLSDWTDSVRALALRALAEGKYPAACDQYRAMLARDSLDALAWFGLGECHRLDSAVIRDRASPTGWRFRSSYQGAVSAYRQALWIAPSLNEALGPEAYTRLAKMLVAEPVFVRPGSALAPDTGLFLAYPALDHDTLLFVPYPTKGMLWARPKSHLAAVERGRALRRELVTKWVEAFPASAAAHAQLALVLELDGQLADSLAGRRSALGEIREAISREPDSLARLYLVLAEIRLLVKQHEFTGARAVADSLLGTADEATSSSAYALACAAALVGRAHLAARLLAATASDSSFNTPISRAGDVPAAVAPPALRLMAYASLGAPVESLAPLERQVDTLLLRWVEPERRETARHLALDISALLAFPVHSLDATRTAGAGIPVYDAQRLLARGDTASARAQLAPIRKSLADQRPASLLPVLVYHEAFLLAAVHDSAGAEQLLDLMLGNLPATSTMLIGEPQEAATLVRAMALRARLAAARRDPATARRWSAAVAALWSGTDVPELRSVIDGLGVR